MGVLPKLLLQMVWDMIGRGTKGDHVFWHEAHGGEAGWWSTATCFQNRYLCALLTAKLPPAFHNELRQPWPLSGHHLSFILHQWCLGSCKWIVSRQEIITSQDHYCITGDLHCCSPSNARTNTQVFPLPQGTFLPYNGSAVRRSSGLQGADIQILLLFLSVPCQEKPCPERSPTQRFISHRHTWQMWTTWPGSGELLGLWRVITTGW